MGTIKVEKIKNRIGQKLYPKVNIRDTEYFIHMNGNHYDDPGTVECYEYMGKLYFDKKEYRDILEKRDPKLTTCTSKIVPANTKYPLVVVALHTNKEGKTHQKEFVSFEALKNNKKYIINRFCSDLYTPECVQDIIDQYDLVKKSFENSEYYNTYKDSITKDPLKMTSYNNKIRTYMQKNKVTQVELADTMNSSDAYIWKILSEDTMTKEEAEEVMAAVNKILKDRDPSQNVQGIIEEEVDDSDSSVKEEFAEKAVAATDPESIAINSHIDFLVDQYGDKVKDEFIKRFNVAEQNQDSNDDLLEDIYNLGVAMGCLKSSMKTKADCDRLLKEPMKKAFVSTMTAVTEKDNPSYKENKKYGWISTETRSTIRGYASSDGFWDILGYKIIFPRGYQTYDFKSIDLKQIVSAVFDSGLGIVMFEYIRKSNNIFDTNKAGTKEYSIYEILMDHFANNIKNTFFTENPKIHVPMWFCEKILKIYHDIAEQEGFYRFRKLFAKEENESDYSTAVNDQASEPEGDETAPGQI